MKRYKIIITLALLMSVFSLFAAGKKETTAELVSGNLKLKFYERSGSFCLYRLSEVGNETWEPLYDDRALASTNYYSLLIDGKIYSIKKRVGKSIKIENNNKEIIAEFPLTDDLYVKQRFYFSDKHYETSGKILCIETSFENTSGVVVDVALKAIFDTNLGEKRHIPLYTDTISIFSETHFSTNPSKGFYIASANSILACIFFLQLEKQTPPSEVFIANWDYLHSKKWTPSIVEGRSFSTKYYNNDSAIMFLWQKKRLNLNETYTVTNCIGCYDYLKRNAPKEAIEVHLQTLPEEYRKKYDYIQELLNQVEEVKNNPDNYSDDEIKNLTKQVDDATIDIQN
ncbi:MAG: hypothetical protein P1P64_09835 [Treponemataceae bacterium]